MAATVVTEKHDVAGVCRRTAEHLLAIGQLVESRLAFDQQGVAWLESYIAASRPNLAADLIDEFIEIAGCFYGECLVETLHGAWARSNDGRLAVVMQPHGYTFPFEAVASQVRGDEEVSIERSFDGAVAYKGSLLNPELAA